MKIFKIINKERDNVSAKNRSVISFFILSYLLLYAFILVVIAVIRAASRIIRKEVDHLVLVERHCAAVGVGVFVVIVEFTALARARSFCIF